MTSKYVIDCSQVDDEIIKYKPEVDDPRRFGELVLKMAIGVIAIPDDPDPVVKQKQQRDLLTSWGIEIPDDVEVEIIQRDLTKLKIMVPPKRMAERAICRLQEMDANHDNSYDGLPPAYKKMEDGEWTDSMEEFYEIRVSDYTLSFCR